MTATPTPLRELPAKLRAEAAGKTDTAYEVGRVAEKLRCAHLIEAALSARDEAGAVVCGACGKEWDGQKCGQAENGWPFPVCYPIATPPAASGDDPVAEIMADWSLRWQAGHAARPGDKLYTRRLAAVAPAGMDGMVNRFLSWPLPQDFAPDAGISFTPHAIQTFGGPYWPVGTNLLTAAQAKAMFAYCLAPTPEEWSRRMARLEVGQETRAGNFGIEDATPPATAGEE